MGFTIKNMKDESFALRSRVAAILIACVAIGGLYALSLTGKGAYLLNFQFQSICHPLRSNATAKSWVIAVLH